MTDLSGRSLVGYGRGTTGGAAFRASNPRTGEPLDPAFVSAADSDVDRAALLADRAFGVLSRFGGRARGGLLRAIAARLEARGPALVARASLETALPEQRLQGELGRTCGQLRLIAEYVEEDSWVGARVDRGDPRRAPNPKPDVRSMRRPLGPVAVFGASNFPIAFSVAGGDTASALAAGCPVLVKAHPAHPGACEIAGLAVQEAVRDAGAPEGVFSLLFDEGHGVGLKLVRHPAIRAVGFTGSRSGGLALVRAAMEREVPIPVYAEMGSVNPVFLLPGAIHERAAEIAAGLHASVTLGVGQFCTNPGLVILERAGSEPFVGELSRRIGATPPAAMLSRAVRDAYREGTDRMGTTPGVVELSLAPGPRGESREPTAGGAIARASLFTTDAQVFLETPDLMQERFGPSTLLVQCRNGGEMREVARGLEGQLTASIHVADHEIETSRDLLSILELKAGRIVVNGFPTGVEVSHAMVHGGPYPATSDGRSTSVGTRSLERFTRWVAFQGVPESLLPEELRDGR